MSEEERRAIIHLLDKQARYEYCRKNNISFSDEEYEAYIIRQSMINKDKEIERLKKSEKEALDTLESATYENINLTNEVDRLNNIINELERLLNNQIENYKDSECEELQAMVQEDKSILFILKELKGSESNE